MPSKESKQGRGGAGRAWRRLPLVALAFAGASGCVSLQAPDLTPEELRSAIRAGELIQPGDKVNLVTSESGERELVVAEVDVDAIRGTRAGEPGASADGDQIVVPIDEVIGVRKRKLHVGRSIAGAGAWWLSAGIVTALVFSFR